MDDGAQATFSHDGGGFILFLDHAMRRGLVAPNVGGNLKTTCTQVLPLALGPHWQAVDILTLDVDDVLARFQVEARRRLPPAALSKRKTELIEALGLFRTFIGKPGPETTLISSPTPVVAPHPPEPQPTPLPETPEATAVSVPPISEGRPDVPARANRVAQPGPARRIARRRSSSSKAVPAMPTQPQSATTRPPRTSKTLTYPFPLRAGVIVRISLPADLTTREARRLARFLETLTVDGDHVPTRAANGHASSSPRPSNRTQAAS